MHGMKAKSGVRAGRLASIFKKPRELLCKSTCYIAHPIELNERHSCHTQCEFGTRR